MWECRVGDARRGHWRCGREAHMRAKQHAPTGPAPASPQTSARQSWRGRGMPTLCRWVLQGGGGMDSNMLGPCWACGRTARMVPWRLFHPTILSQALLGPPLLCCCSPPCPPVFALQWKDPEAQPYPQLAPRPNAVTAGGPLPSAAAMGAGPMKRGKLQASGNAGGGGSSSSCQVVQRMSVAEHRLHARLCVCHVLSLALTWLSLCRPLVPPPAAGFHRSQRRGASGRAAARPASRARLQVQAQVYSEPAAGCGHWRHRACIRGAWSSSSGGGGSGGAGGGSGRAWRSCSALGQCRASECRGSGTGHAAGSAICSVAGGAASGRVGRAAAAAAARWKSTAGAAGSRRGGHAD